MLSASFVTLSQGRSSQMRILHCVIGHAGSVVNDTPLIGSSKAVLRVGCLWHAGVAEGSPPVGLLARWAPEGSTLSGYDTSNKVILVSPYVQHMDPQVWGPDVALYRPERWLEADNPAQHVSPYSYMPFSRGPRDCIGSRFALLEAKTILSMIYRQFEFEYAGRKPEEVVMKVTAHPRYGVPLRVRWRQGAPSKTPNVRSLEGAHAEYATLSQVNIEQLCQLIIQSSMLLCPAGMLLLLTGVVLMPSLPAAVSFFALTC